MTIPFLIIIISSVLGIYFCADTIALYAGEKFWLRILAWVSILVFSMLIGLVVLVVTAQFMG